MNRKKAVLTLLSLLLVALLLVSCTYGSYATKKSVRKFGADRMYMRYESFSGHLYRKIRLSDGEKLVVEILSQTKSGGLSILILDENDAVLVSRDTETTQKTVHEIVAQSKTVYRIKVEGTHSGSFDISWNKE